MFGCSQLLVPFFLVWIHTSSYLSNYFLLVNSCFCYYWPTCISLSILRLQHWDDLHGELKNSAHVKWPLLSLGKSKCDNNSNFFPIINLPRGTTSGVFCGSPNFLKDALSIAKACRASNQALPWYFYLFAILAAVLGIIGMFVLNRCMKIYDATFSVSMFVGSLIISVSIMAEIHYHTFEHLTGWIGYIMYPTGLVVLLIGIYLLVSDIPDDLDFPQQDSDESDDQTSSSTPTQESHLVSSNKQNHIHIIFSL